MARQRFIWPTIWDDPDLGRLPEAAMLLYIACFSNADDAGRLLGDPVYLRSLAFRYRDMTTDDIIDLRNQLERACKSFRVYTHDDTEYVAFANWEEFQKPKYPTPSKLPAPPGIRKSRRKPASRKRISSGNGSEQVPEGSGNGSGTVPLRAGQGRVGLGSIAVSLLETPETAPTTSASLPFAQEVLLGKIIAHIGAHADDRTAGVVRSYATHLTDAVLARVLESSLQAKPNNRAAYIVGALKSEVEGAAA